MAAYDQTGSVRHVVWFASVVVTVVLLVALFSWAFQRRLIYLPSTGAVPSAATMLAGARDVQLTTSDGLRLGAWYIPARRRDGPFTVLVANAATQVTAACGRRLPERWRTRDSGCCCSTTGAMAATRGAQARKGWLETYAPHVSSSSTRACPVTACCTTAKASVLRWSLSWRPSTRRQGLYCDHRLLTSPRWDGFTTRLCPYVRC